MPAVFSRSNRNEPSFFLLGAIQPVLKTAAPRTSRIISTTPPGPGLLHTLHARLRTHEGICNQARSCLRLSADAKRAGPKGPALFSARTPKGKDSRLPPCGGPHARP